jgi:hypothetical protein
MVRKNYVLSGNASEDWVWLHSFLDKVDLFLSSLGLIDSRLVSILGVKKYGWYGWDRLPDVGQTLVWRWVGIDRLCNPSWL